MVKNVLQGRRYTVGVISLLKGLLSRGVILLHDNARPHTARLTLQTVNNLGLEVLQHPPYSPDLAPSDPSFSSHEKMLGGQKFASEAKKGL